MNKFLLTLTALALGLPAFAADKKPAADGAKKTPEAVKGTPPDTAAKTAGEAKPLPMHSRVDALNAASKSFTHKNADGKEVKFVLTDKTEIKQGDTSAKFGDIKVGDYVSGLRMKKSDTEYEVVKITKFGPEEKKPKAAGDAKPPEKKTN